MPTIDLHAAAERALQLMLAQGFEHAQSSARLSRLTELNIELNRPACCAAPKPTAWPCWAWSGAARPPPS